MFTCTRCMQLYWITRFQIHIWKHYFINAKKTYCIALSFCLCSSVDLASFYLRAHCLCPHKNFIWCLHFSKFYKKLFFKRTFYTCTFNICMCLLDFTTFFIAKMKVNCVEQKRNLYKNFYLKKQKSQLVLPLKKSPDLVANCYHRYFMGDLT